MTRGWEMHLGDCAEVMRDMPQASVEAVICDPPYGLGFMNSNWDAFRDGRSFQAWSERWASAAWRLLKPGGYLLAFGGTRTYHRLACGVEDAGYEVRDMVLWIYGEGFPKSRDVSKDIDAMLGEKREVVGQRTGADPATTRPGFTGAAHSRIPNQTKLYDVTSPASPEAKQWEGWGTGLKPACEPLVVARKPLAGTIAENVLVHDVGALNIEASRVGSEGGAYGGGRWPANVTLGHLPGCNGHGARHSLRLCVPGCPVAGVAWQGGDPRFFYVTKPTRSERDLGTFGNLHVTVKPIALMRWLIRLVTPPGGVVLDPFAGSGTTGCAAAADGYRFIGIEQDEEMHNLASGRVADAYFGRRGRED